MVTRYCCQNELRLRLARSQRGVDGQYINGIDYLEVFPEQTTLTVHLLHSLASSLDRENVHLTDDMGVTVPLESVNAAGKLITIRLNSLDHPSYSLSLVESPLTLLKLGYQNLDPTELPPPQG
ncbi:MAG: hypothetical protein ACKPGW_28515, partial [Microcystis panniformis]